MPRTHHRFYVGRPVRHTILYSRLLPVVEWVSDRIFLELKTYIHNSATEQRAKVEELKAGIEAIELENRGIWTALKVWSTHPDKVLSTLSLGMINRNIFKAVSYTHLDVYKRQDMQRTHKRLWKELSQHAAKRPKSKWMPKT